jgi:hypothetical protein
MDRVNKVESLREIIDEMTETDGINGDETRKDSIQDCSETMNQAE